MSTPPPQFTSHTACGVWEQQVTINPADQGYSLTWQLFLGKPVSPLTLHCHRVACWLKGKRIS